MVDKKYRTGLTALLTGWEQKRSIVHLMQVLDVLCFGTLQPAYPPCTRPQRSHSSLRSLQHGYLRA